MGVNPSGIFYFMGISGVLQGLLRIEICKLPELLLKYRKYN